MSEMVRNGMSDSDRLKYYRKRFATILNSLNTTVYWTERPRNDSAKTEDFQGDIRMDDFEESVNWASSQGLIVKGHPMFWTVPKAMPDWLTRYPWETMEKFVEVRIRNLAARYKGRVKVWDAVNEMLWEPHPKNILKREWPWIETMDNMVDYVSKVLKWAREEDPDALYTINDYGIDTIGQEGLKSQDGQPVNPQLQRRRYLELVRRLSDSGMAPNMMGLQCHTGWMMPSDQMAFYDEMSSAGIPLSITEFGANTRELMNLPVSGTESEEWRSFTNGKKIKDLSEPEAIALRDQYIIDYMTCAFAHPNIDSFYFWGFMGMAVKFSDSFNAAHEIQPLYEKMDRLINQEWKTRLKVKTDSSGELRFNGFCGEYSVRAIAENGQKSGYRFSVQKNQPINNYVIKTIL